MKHYRKILAAFLSLSIIIGLLTVPVFAQSSECVSGGTFDSEDDIKNWSYGSNRVEWIKNGGRDGNGCIKAVPKDKDYINLAGTTTLKKNQWYLSRMWVKLLPNPDGSRAESDAKMMLMQAYDEYRTTTKVNSDEWTEVYGCFKYLKDEDEKTSALIVRVGQNEADTIKYGAYIDDISIVPFGEGELIAGGNFDDYHPVLSTSSYKDSDLYGNNNNFRCDPFVGVHFANSQNNSYKVEWIAGGKNDNDTGHILVTPQPNTWFMLNTAEINIEPHQWYKMSVRAKLAGDDRDSEVKFRIGCVGSELSGITAVNPEDGWKEVCTYFKYDGEEAVGQQLQMRIGQNGRVPNGGIYLDDWKLEKVGTDRLINGDFETNAVFAANVSTGSFMPWIPNVLNNVQYSTEDFYSGKQSLKIKGGDWVKQSRSFKNGTLYELKSAVKVSDMSVSGTDGIYASMYYGKECVAKKKLDEGWNVIKAFSDELSGDDYFYTRITVEDENGKIINSKTAKLVYYLDSAEASEPTDIVLNGGFEYDLSMWNISGADGEHENGGLKVIPTEDSGKAFQNVKLPYGNYILKCDVTSGSADVLLENLVDEQGISGKLTKFFTVDSDGEYNLSFSSQNEFAVNNVVIEKYLPKAQNVVIDGYSVIGDTINGSYEYISDEGYPIEGESHYRWLCAENTISNDWQTISEGNVTADSVAELTILKEYQDKYIRFAITPVDENGIEGETVYSRSVKAVKRFDTVSKFTGNFENGADFGFESQIKNNTDADEYITVMLAIYDDTGRMCGVTAKKSVIGRSETVNFSDSLTLPNDINGYSAKLMYWYGLPNGVTDMRIADSYLQK